MIYLLKSDSYFLFSLKVSPLPQAGYLPGVVEGPPDELWHPLPAVHHPPEHREQPHELVVLRVVAEPAADEDAVLQLEPEGLEAVVDDDGAVEVAAQDVEVLDVLAPGRDVAAVAVDSVLDEASLRVDGVQQGAVAVGLVRSVIELNDCNRIHRINFNVRRNAWKL